VTIATSLSNDAAELPHWAGELRRRYLRGEASLFILHGNVFDLVLHQEKLLSLTEFLTDVLLRESRESIITYNVASGVRFAKRSSHASPAEELLLASSKERVLSAMEKLLMLSTRAAVILEYGEVIAPAGDPNFQSEADRTAIVTLHRWSMLPQIERGDNVIIILTENLSEIAPKVVSNPKVGVIEVPMPDAAMRRAVSMATDPRMSEREAERYGEITAGLKAVQISSILAPPPAQESETRERERYIAQLLGDGDEARARARKLAELTTGLEHDEIRRLLAPGRELDEPAAGSIAETIRHDIDLLIARRKREIIERECFGLVEFVESTHGFDAVGGMEEIKKDLLVIAESIREGRTNRVPMGLLFTGPMGTGKTFVAEAFAKECSLTTIKLKNFRSKWVGATEGNLEKILSVIRAIGQVIVIIDEGDRAFGSADGDSDGGTSSRVIARIKEFMSDTSNRGRILFIVMTNRPDRLDLDLKRAGRLDRKIPFLYAQTAEEVESVACALIRKNRVRTDVVLEQIREEFSERLVGYSNADVEAIILMAHDDAAREDGLDAAVTSSHFIRAAEDYFPSRDGELLEYMELLAIFETSSRRLLPARYQQMAPEQLDARMRQLRATVAGRR
jgi:transitional endoplasmic reticulum ATPase